MTVRSLSNSLFTANVIRKPFVFDTSLASIQSAICEAAGVSNAASLTPEKAAEAASNLARKYGKNEEFFKCYTVTGYQSPRGGPVTDYVSVEDWAQELAKKKFTP